jgi:protein SCO1/2
VACSQPAAEPLEIEQNRFMKTKVFFSLIIALAAGAIASSLALTRRSAATARAGKAAATRTFQVNGRVREITPATKTVSVAHEAIPDYMPAMTMPLQVKDAALLDGLRAGDEIHFELSVTDDDSWISHLEKIGSGNSGATDLAPVSAAPEELRKGDLVPDFALTDENGKSVRLSDFRGQAVVLTFIYTRCPLPNFCPLMSKNFQALQERLSKAFPGKCRLLSVSIDPKFDRPEVLKGYAALYQADSRCWSFATGTEEQINEIASAFGLVHEQEGGMISHNLRSALISPDRHLVHLWKSNVWTPYEVHRMIEESVFNSTAVAKAH